MEEILSKIGFDWKLAIANLVNFLVIFWVLKRFAFEKIEAVIDERKKRADEGLLKAKQAEEKLAGAEEQKREIVLAAKKEGHEVIAKAHNNAELILKHAQDEAFKERSDILEQARKRIESEEKEMEAALKAEAAELITEGARKALEGKAGPDLQNKIVDNYTK